MGAPPWFVNLKKHNYRELPNIWAHFDGLPNSDLTFIVAICTWIKRPFSTLGKSGGEADPRYQSREGVQQLCRWRQKIQITRKIQRQKRYQSTTTFLKQTGFLDFKSDCQNCKSSNVAKIWMETTCSRSFIAFCGGKQWKLASAFTFLWRNPLIGFHSIKFHFEFCVKSFKHS